MLYLMWLEFLIQRLLRYKLNTTKIILSSLIVSCGPEYKPSSLNHLWRILPENIIRIILNNTTVQQITEIKIHTKGKEGFLEYIILMKISIKALISLA